MCEKIKFYVSQFLSYVLAWLILNFSGAVNTADWPAGEEVSIVFRSEIETCDYISLEEWFNKNNN